ncbi:phage-related baseplate assembly protein [Lacrimispora xylanisolvens]|uniref:Phage-related baseplate assembly protein n=1 Tax=Lacrimispora xylanisolvens TaxID=384636 RepID=A0A2S6HV43_9FIRM|nr:baseplate J/gp47 family protein [Hungatella xylanolytica]PPK81634.1 phage-related baseplate assembly protein [Hungatella xylanolytica]
MESRFSDYPEVSFIENTSFSDLQERLIHDYEEKYRELTGEDVSLGLADPYRLILYSCAVAIYQGYQYEDKAGKMGLLKYSTGEFLDNLAAFKKVKRNEAAPARTVIRFTLADKVERAVVIPKGTRVKGPDLYFTTTKKSEIKSGQLYTDIAAECEQSGTIGNGYLPGEIKWLTDLLPYTMKVSNIVTTSGGADRENDEELAERIYLSPVSYSTAGPERAYEYWVKTFSPAIGECLITSESPGEVDIYVTMADGTIPDDVFLKNLETYLSDSNIRPLTDHVVVKKPEEIKYNIELIYYILNEDRDREETMKEAVSTACNNYITWQKKVGRDINPAQLLYYIMGTGVKMADIVEPVFTEVPNSALAVPDKITLAYGGRRDD